MTNSDWVRSLQNEELAEFIYHFEFDGGCCQFTNRFNEKKNKSGGCSENCCKCLLEWLESERDAD